MKPLKTAGESSMEDGVQTSGNAVVRLLCVQVFEKDTHHLPASNTTQSMLYAMPLLPGKWIQLSMCTVAVPILQVMQVTACRYKGHKCSLVPFDLRLQMNRANP